jgi:hypothetical protein
MDQQNSPVASELKFPKFWIHLIYLLFALLSTSGLCLSLLLLTSLWNNHISPYAAVILFIVFSADSEFRLSPE